MPLTLVAAAALQALSSSTMTITSSTSVTSTSLRLEVTSTGSRMILANEHVHLGFDLKRQKIDVLKPGGENSSNLLSEEGIVLEYEPFSEHGAMARRPSTLSTPLVPKVLKNTSQEIAVEIPGVIDGGNPPTISTSW